MNGRRLSGVADELDGTLVGYDGNFVGVCTDTRLLTAGQLFVALTGPNFDGHDFLVRAAELGAAGAVVNGTRDNVSLPQIVVEDTRRALGELGAAWRSQFNGNVIAVTGSNGKTTVKEMLAAILQERASTLATSGNLNNDIGVPLTLLRLRPEHRWAVVELGTNHPGEIAALTEMASPSVGVVTNAAPAHLEGFGSLAGVAREKGQLFAYLDPDGIAVINADDVFEPLWREMAGDRRIVTFGQSEGADFVADRVHDALRGAEVSVRFELRTPVGNREIHLPFAGRHNAVNAAAAAAAAWSCGATLGEIAAGLAKAPKIGGRLVLLWGVGGVRIIDDSYNANPGSVRAALEMLTELPGRPWMVFANMAELGADAQSMHEDIGAMARDLGVERLFTLGELGAAAARVFGAQARSFEKAEDLIETLRGEVTSGVNLLVKGSRSMRLENVVEALIASEPRLRVNGGN